MLSQETNADAAQETAKVKAEHEDELAKLLAKVRIAAGRQNKHSMQLSLRLRFRQKTTNKAMR